jgi:CubicO group peptidase (beta-lactamase class C family)
MKEFFLKLVRFAAAISFILACPGAHAATRRPADDQREFASFVDGFLAGIQKDRVIPGMAFVAVRNGEVLYLKGYGVADLESGTPVDPERTMFRTGSLSEPVTATAVMQLAERGRISLDEDVNIYSRRWKLPETFPEPVTVRNLLTHTAGLGYRELEISAPTSGDERAYAARISKIMPPRYASPGEFYCPTGIGYAMLGSIVERYARLNFADTIKKYVFTPLGMENSTFALTDASAPNLATGYDKNGAPVQYDYRYDLPAVGMSASAADMGRFIAAQLSGGSGGGRARNRVLSDMYAGSMMRRHFSPHPMISGTGLGYIEKYISGLRTLQRTGQMNGYSSFLLLIPEKNFGLYFAANVTGLDFEHELSRAVVERFFQAPADKTPAESADEFSIYPDILGYYRTNRISRDTAEKIARLAADQSVISYRDGFIEVGHTIERTPPTRWRPVAGSDDLFRRVDDAGFYTDEYMFFQRDAEGRVEAMVASSVENTCDKLKPYENHYWQLAIIAGFASTALLSSVGLCVGYAVNRGKFPWEKGLRSNTELWGISSVFCAVQIAFVLGLAYQCEDNT